MEAMVSSEISTDSNLQGLATQRIMIYKPSVVENSLDENIYFPPAS
jgi:hypothetical protein